MAVSRRIKLLDVDSLKEVKRRKLLEGERMAWLGKSGDEDEGCSHERELNRLF